MIDVGIAGCCDNDKRYPERMKVHDNVKDGKILFNKLPVNEERHRAWIHALFSQQYSSHELINNNLLDRKI